MTARALVHGRVFDGVAGQVIDDGAVVIDDDRIVRVGAADAIEAHDDVEVIDVCGKTILPGIIDAHMHVTRMPESLDHFGHIEQTVLAIEKLRKQLRRGITTVANVGGCPESVYLRDAIDAGRITGCSGMLVGAMVNATGGHVRGRPADGPWEVRKAVREMVMHNVDFIKTAASGGFQWAHERVEWQDYTPEELTALVAESHGKDMPVAVHAHSQPGLNHAIDAGCDMITHGALIDDDALAGIQANDLYFVPTLFITSHHVTDRPHLPDHMRDRMTHAHPIHRAGVRKARAMGIKICVGTDGQIGDAMKELIELVACGLPPAEAIRAATAVNAQALGVGDRLGTLEPGKQADVVVVDGDPLTDVGVLDDPDNITIVVKRGRVAYAAPQYIRHIDSHCDDL